MACIREVGEVARAAIGQLLQSLCNEDVIKTLSPLAVPVYHVYGIGRLQHGDLTCLLANVPEFSRLIPACVYRAVAYSFEKLSYILSFGIDVNPPYERIYACQNIDKCGEYGGYPKIVMCLDSSKLKNTWATLPEGASQEERNSILKDYPYSVKCEDGSELFSRIKDEPHRFSGYEFEYAKWIPGNPREVLKSVIIIDDGLCSDASDSEWQGRIVSLLTGQVESPEMCFIRKRIEEGLI